MSWSRREALRLLTLGLAGLVAACKKEGASLSEAAPAVPRMPEDRRAALGAAVDRVMPGALAAGGLAYLDRLFAEGPFKGLAREFDTGALLMNRAARERFGKPFASATAAEQDAVLKDFLSAKIGGKSFDGPSFYKRLVLFTLEGHFGDPKYGGNAGEAGWKLIGRQSCHFAPARLADVLPARPVGRQP